MAKIDLQYMTDFLLRLLNTPSPTGNTRRAVTLVEEEFRKLGIQTRRTVKNALLATLPGRDPTRQRALTAHVDTLGAMVKEIKDNGRLQITNIGGLPAQAVEGEYVVVETSGGRHFTGTIVPNKASVHVFGKQYGELERKFENMEVRLDEKTRSKEDTERLGIRPGDFVFVEPRAQLTASGFLKSRFLDDKASVATLLGAAKYIVDNKVRLAATTHFHISVYEEVGHGAPAGIPQEVTEVIAVDMAAVGKGQASDEYSVTVCAADSTGPYDLELRQRLVSLAEKAELSVKVDIYPHYGSDASAAVQAGWDVRHGLIGPGVDASHTHERLHLEALVNTARLIVEYLSH